MGCAVPAWIWSVIRFVRDSALFRNFLEFGSKIGRGAKRGLNKWRYISHGVFFQARMVEIWHYRRTISFGQVARVVCCLADLLLSHYRRMGSPRTARTSAAEEAFVWTTVRLIAVAPIRFDSSDSGYSQQLNSICFQVLPLASEIWGVLEKELRAV